MQTEPRIVFKNMDHSDFLEARIQERIDRLDRLNDRIIACRVVVETPNHSSEAKTALGISIDVEVPQRTLIAKEVQQRHEAKPDALAFVNRAFDAIERQLEDDARIKQRHVKRHESSGAIGRVATLIPERGYGTIEVRGEPSLYFNRDVVKNGAFDALRVGAMVRVVPAAEEGPLGPQASSVHLLGEDIGQ